MKTLLTLLALQTLFTLNSSAQWVQVDNEMGIIWSLAANVNTIFAGTELNGVYLSTDNGTNWTQTSLNNRSVWSLAVNGNNIFAGTADPPYGVYVSTDNGTSWTQTSLNNLGVYSIAVSGNNIFAGTGNPGQGVYLSTNNGTSWTQTSLNNLWIFSLGVNGNNIFAGIYNYPNNGFGVYKSTDNGTSWTQTSLNNRHVWSLAVNGNNIFAGTAGDPPFGVYVSTDNGANWTQTSLNNENVLSFALNGNYIFTGTYLTGVYVSNDNGASWTPRNEGLEIGYHVYALCILNNYIFAGTAAVVYRRPLGELTGIHPISTEIPNQFSLSQNYPNPFNPSTVIRYSLLVAGMTTLTIFDASGREAATLVNEQLNAGTYEVDFDGTNYPSGVYHYHIVVHPDKLVTDRFIETKSMVLIK